MIQLLNRNTTGYYNLQKQRNKLPCNKIYYCFRNKLQRQNSERLSEFGDGITLASECRVYSVSGTVIRYDR